MKYSVLIINSNNIADYVDDIANGVRYDNLEKYDVDNLIRLSLEQNFSVVIQKNEEEGK